MYAIGYTNNELYKYTYKKVVKEQIKLKAIL